MDVAKLMTGAAIAPSWGVKPGGLHTPDSGETQRDSGAPNTPVLKVVSASASDSRAIPGFEKIEAMREEINRAGRNRLQIDRAEDNGRFIYRILDPDTGETMRQWPPDRYLELVEYLDDKRGGLMDQTV